MSSFQTSIITCANLIQPLAKAPYVVLLKRVQRTNLEINLQIQDSIRKLAMREWNFKNRKNPTGDLDSECFWKFHV